MQYVSIDSIESNIMDSLPCSVIQGSKLSALLYTLYVNEVQKLSELMGNDAYNDIHTRDNTYLTDLDDKVMKDIRCKKRAKPPVFRYADTRTKPLRTLSATIYRR